jgi:hypothetical protein
MIIGKIRFTGSKMVEKSLSAKILSQLAKMVA